MRKELQDILAKATRELTNQLDPDHDLKFMLLECLTRDQHEKVYTVAVYPTRAARVAAIIDCLKLSQDSYYDVFRGFIKQIERDDLTVNCLPEINASHVKEKIELNALSFLDKPRLHGVIRVGEYISGLTVLDSQLFVVLGSTQVNVYDTNNLTLTRNISITGSFRLDAIVASPRYNCLYISDPERSVVYRYNLSDNVINNWSIGGQCYGLSLTSTYNILVTLRDTKQIKKYTPDEILVREISLDCSIESPYHSVQLSSGQFVVSHGTGGEPIQRVCIIDTSGRVIKCYRGSKGSGVGQLNIPINLAVDMHGNVLVADLYNNRVVLLSPSLTHLGYLAIPEHTLNSPIGLHLDLLTHSLYIGENTNGRVLRLTV